MDTALSCICSLVVKFQHQKMLFLLFFVGILAPTITDAHSIQLHEEPKTDFRTIFETYDPDEETLEVGRTFGYSNISLVITYTTLVVAALMLAGFLWLAFSYSGNSSGGYGRRKRESPFESDDEDMAFKLYSLNESFRKYQMEDLECKMYVACEAGKQLHGENHEDFGSLTKRIHKIFKSLKFEEADNLPESLSKIFIAYQEGYLLNLSCNSIYSAICPFVEQP